MIVPHLRLARRILVVRRPPRSLLVHLMEQHEDLSIALDQLLEFDDQGMERLLLRVSLLDHGLQPLVEKGLIGRQPFAHAVRRGAVCGRIHPHRPPDSGQRGSQQRAEIDRWSETSSAARAKPLVNTVCGRWWTPTLAHRSEEHTSELQSPCNLVCRLLLEKKKTKNEKQLLTWLQKVTR